MRKKPDLPPRSEKDPAPSADAQSAETNHYEPWSKLSSTDQDLKLDQFFKRWELPAADFADCLPEAELRKKVEGRRNRAEWPEHVQNCANCSSLAELLSDPDRVRIPVSRILEEASRKAWEIEHSGRRRSFTVRHVTSLFKSIPQHRRTPILVGAAAVFVLMLAWVGYQYYQSKTPSSVVAFDNRRTPVQGETYASAIHWFDKPIEILEAGNYNTKEKVEYLEPLQSSKPKVDVTFNQANLDGSQRAKAGTVVTKYNSRLTALKDSAKAQNLDTKNLPVPTTADSEIVTKVFFAFGSTDAPTVFNAEGKKSAETILEGASLTTIEAIEPKSDQKTVVKITIPQDFFEQKDLDRRLKSLETQGLEVVVASYSPPRGPKSKLKAINAGP